MIHAIENEYDFGIFTKYSTILLMNCFRQILTATISTTWSNTGPSPVTLSAETGLNLRHRNKVST